MGIPPLLQLGVGWDGNLITEGVAILSIIEEEEIILDKYMDNLIITIIIEMPFHRGRIFLLQIFIKIKDFSSSSSSSSFISSSSRITKAIIITLKTLTHLIKITLLISWIMNTILIKIKAIACQALIILITIIEMSQIIAV